MIFYERRQGYGENKNIFITCYHGKHMTRRISGKQYRKAFSLVEVMVSLLVLSLTAVAVYMSLASLSGQEVFVRDRQAAKNILASTYEQLRQHIFSDVTIFNNFAALYPASGSWAAVHEPRYPDGFFETRIAFISGTSELKNFSIAVRWTDHQNTQKHIDHIFSLARPLILCRVTFREL